MSDLKTEAIVLRRTNIGEADRLINLLTPGGKITVKARSVRKEKSRLAGGIEMFCLSQVGIHQSQKTKNNILTSAKMIKFYENILADLPRLELASEILRQVSKAAEQTDSPEYFEITRECLEALDKKVSPDVVSAWFYFNLVRIKGEQVNLISDTNGEPLNPEENYVWDSTELSLHPLHKGRISAPEIKIMRLMLSSPLSLVSRIEKIEDFIPEVLHVAKSLNQL